MFKYIIFLHIYSIIKKNCDDANEIIWRRLKGHDRNKIYLDILIYNKKKIHTYILHSDKRKQFTTRQRSQQQRRRWLISLQSNKSRSNSNKQPNRKTKRKQCTKESNKQETKQLLVRSADVQRNPKASNKLRKTKKSTNERTLNCFCCCQ